MVPYNPTHPVGACTAVVAVGVGGNEVVRRVDVVAAAMEVESPRLKDWGLHYLLDKVVHAGTAPGPNCSDHTPITITNGEGMPRMRTFRETISQNKVQQMGGARGRAYAIDGGT
ncbi:hypothetical protein Tco_0940510 [Tanacetum coccineum]|uniref:Uncharacterized protein n=1 Tax=Tanacetum coccineum TaxID=301880 RepID=A0ABQ5DNU2_9ASTR